MRRRTRVKFTTPKSPLQTEPATKTVASSEWKHKQVLSALNQSIKGAQNEDEAAAFLALKAQLTTDQLKDKLDDQFLDGFHNWMLGRGTPAEVARTAWGRANAAQQNREVARYVDSLMKARLHYALELVKMSQRAPRSLNEYWLYYKYIVHGKGRIAMNQAGGYFDFTDDSYLDDWDLMTTSLPPPDGVPPIDPTGGRRVYPYGKYLTPADDETAVDEAVEHNLKQPVSPEVKAEEPKPQPLQETHTVEPVPVTVKQEPKGKEDMTDEQAEQELEEQRKQEEERRRVEAQIAELKAENERMHQERERERDAHIAAQAALSKKLQEAQTTPMETGEDIVPEPAKSMDQTEFASGGVKRDDTKKSNVAATKKAKASDDDEQPIITEMPEPPPQLPPPEPMEPSEPDNPSTGKRGADDDEAPTTKKRATEPPQLPPPPAEAPMETEEPEQPFPFEPPTEDDTLAIAWYQEAQDSWDKYMGESSRALVPYDQLDDDDELADLVQPMDIDDMPEPPASGHEGVFEEPTVAAPFVDGVVGKDSLSKHRDNLRDMAKTEVVQPVDLLKAEKSIDTIDKNVSELLLQDMVEKGKSQQVREFKDALQASKRIIIGQAVRMIQKLHREQQTPEVVQRLEYFQSNLKQLRKVYGLLQRKCDKAIGKDVKSEKKPEPATTSAKVHAKVAESRDKLKSKLDAIRRGMDAEQARAGHRN